MSEPSANDATPSKGTGTSEQKAPGAGIVLWWAAVLALLVLVVVGMVMAHNEQQQRMNVACSGEESTTFTVTASDDATPRGNDALSSSLVESFERLVGDEPAPAPCSVAVNLVSGQIDDAEERYDLIHLTVEGTTCTYQTRAGDLRQSVCDWVPVQEGSHTAEAVHEAVDAEIPDATTWNIESGELASLKHLRIEDLEPDTESDA